MKALICQGVVSLCGVAVLHAAYPLVVDDAAIHPPKEIEIDFSVDAQRDVATESMASNLSLTAGLHPRIEGSIAFGYGWQRERHSPSPDEREGILDLSLGTKVPLLDPASAPVALTLSSTVVIPTASSDLGVDTTNLNLLLIATREWGCVSMDTNVGLNWAPVDGAVSNAEDAAFAGIAVRWNVSGRWMLFAETYAWMPVHAAGDPHHLIRCGYQVELIQGLFLGGAVAAGYGGTEHAGASLGLTWVF